MNQMKKKHWLRPDAWLAEYFIGAQPLSAFCSALVAVTDCERTPFYFTFKCLCLIMPHYLVHCKQTRFCNIGALTTRSVALAKRANINKNTHQSIWKWCSASSRWNLAPSFTSSKFYERYGKIDHSNWMAHFVQKPLFPLMECTQRIYHFSPDSLDKLNGIFIGSKLSFQKSFCQFSDFALVGGEK